MATVPFSSGPGLSIEFLGTGTSVGVPIIGCSCEVCTSTNSMDKRLRCSALIQTDNTTVLIDTGPDLRTQLLRSGTTHLDGVFITHYHADHVVGIDDLRRFNHLQKELINCHADARTLARIDHCFDYIFSDTLRPGLPNLRPIEFSAGTPFVIGDIELTPLALDHHIIPSAGFIATQLNTPGKKRSIAYCLDCKRIPVESLALLQNIDTLVLDMLRESPHPTHLCLQEALDYLDVIKPKQTIFSHIGHEIDHRELTRRLRSGESRGHFIKLAYDGMRMKLPTRLRKGR